jgi:TRAP-type C4-dicarboxylate transport system permease small subunit
MAVHMKYLDKLDLLLNKALMIVGGIALLALMILATGNVAMRIFRIPFSGSYEIISFLGAVVTAAALGYTQRNRDHIVVDIVSAKFPPGAKKIINAVSYLIIAVFFTIVSRQTFLWGMRLREVGELSETLKIIYHPFVFGVAVGFAFLALACTIDFLKTFFNGGNGGGGLSYE